MSALEPGSRVPSSGLPAMRAGTELAAAGMNLLVLRELMAHASPETTAGYVHLSPQTLAAEYAAARAVSSR